MNQTTDVTANVREISHEVRVDLTDAPPLKTFNGRRRKPVGLRIQYGARRDVSRVDITVEFRNSAEHFPPVSEMPEWMRRIVEANRPADVDSPDDDRRTGMGGWPLPAPTVELAEDDGVPGICWCSRAKESGENHSMCYPGME